MFILNKNLSTYLKGIAIILMVIWHSLGWPDWLVYPISYPATYLQPYSKYIAGFAGFAVVQLFLFLTGYTYYHHKDKSIQYSIKKIIVFLIDYWIVYFIFLTIAIFYCNYNFSIIDIFTEMFALTNNVMAFNWYVFLYIEVMLFLPVLNHLSNKYPLKKTLLILLMLFVLAEIISLALLLVFEKKFFLYKAISSYFVKQVPISIIGYFSAKFNLIQNVRIYLIQYPKWLLYFSMFLSVVVYAFKSKLVYILTPYYVSLMSCFSIDYSNIFNRLILFLGKHSMNIWFLQCIFYANATKFVFQKYAYLPQNPFLVVIWILLLCSIGSIIITSIQKRINNLIL